MKKLFCAIIVVMLLMLSGCGKSQIDPPTEKNTSVSKNEKTDQNEAVRIYRLNREEYVSFTQILTPDFFTGSKDFQGFTKDGGYYITTKVTRIMFRTELIDFISDDNAIKEYLLKNGKTEDVQTAVFFDAPDTPLTLFVKTKSEDLFITVNEETDDNDYVYRLYTKSGYLDKYGQRFYSLSINGRKVINDKSVKTFFQNADLPLLKILKELGADIVEAKESEFLISYNNKTFILNTKNHTLVSSENNEENLLDLDGGVTYKYFSNGDYYTDVATFQHAVSTIINTATVSFLDNEQRIDIII